MATFEMPKVKWPAGESLPARGPEAAPFLPWGEFLAAWRWKQGEHVSLIGPTGQGKTTLALAILELRTYVVLVATKPKDSGLAALTKRGWKRTPSWPVRKGTKKVLLWPPYKKPEYERKQIEVFVPAFDDIFEDGGWCIYFDEVAYMVDDLKLGQWVRRFWRQGRSNDITVLAATQRPVDVPLDMYSAASWLFLWRTNDRRDLDRLAGLGAANAEQVRHYVQRLAAHEVLVVGTRDGTMLRTKVELATGR